MLTRNDLVAVGTSIIKLSDLATKFKCLLNEKGITKTVNVSRLREKIEARFPNCSIERRNKLIYILFKDQCELLLEEIIGNADLSDVDKVLLKAANILRPLILGHKKNLFEGSFNEDCQEKSVPEKLKYFVAIFDHIQTTQKKKFPAGPNSSTYCFI